MVLISNKTYVKSLISFPSDRHGTSGTGKWCWSNGGGVTTKDRTPNPMTVKSNFSVECGLESEANPQYNYEINNAFGSAVDRVYLHLKEIFQPGPLKLAIPIVDGLMNS